MYNEEFKTSYIEEIKPHINESTLKQVTVYFNNCEEFETEHGKDIAYFNISEILGYYKTIGTTSLAYLQSANSQFLKYADWLQKGQMLPGNQNHFREININMLEQCLDTNMITAKYITREKLLRLIRSYIFDEQDNLLLLALFEGICGNEYEEIRNLYMLNFNGNVVTLCTNRVLKVSDDLVELAKESAETYTYTTSDNKVRRFDPNDKRCFKFPEKACGNTNREKFFIVRHLTKMRGDDGSRDANYFIGSKELRESGRIDLIKRLMKESGLGVEDCIREYSEIEYRYGKIPNKLRYYNMYKSMFEE